MLLVAEDVHRAGEQDARALRTLVEHPPTGLRAVLTYRPEELAHPGLVLRAPVGYPAEMNLLRLQLGPLDEAAVHEMAVEALGEDRCSAQFLTRLYERSGGIAQAVADLLTELKTAGPLPGVRPTVIGRDRLTARNVDEAAVPVRLTELVVGRMAALDEETRRLAWAAAVLDEAATEDELSSVADLSVDSGRNALTAALCEAVLHELGLGQYGFRMPMEAAAVYQLLAGPVRRELHGRTAAVLGARRPTPWARLARHQLASGRTTDWLQSVEKAAHEAVEAGDHQSAIALLEDTLANPLVAHPNRARLALMLARSAYSGLRSDQTVQVLRRLVDDPELPAAVRGEIRLDLGLLLGNQLGQATGYVDLIKSVEELRGQARLAARAMAALALPYWPHGPLAENLDWLARAETTAAESGDTVVQAAVAANQVTVLLSVGDPDGWRQLAGLPRQSADPEVLQHAARGVCNAVDAAIWLGEYTRARELLAEGPRLALRSGDVHQEQIVQSTELHLDMVTGRWAGLASRSRAYVTEVGDTPVAAGDAMLVLGVLALAKGDWAQAGTWLSAAIGSSEERCPVPLAAATAGGRIRLALAREDLQAAARETSDGWAAVRAKGVWVWATELAPWAVEATVRDGELDAARKLVVEFAAGIESRQAPAATAALMRCHALLAEADGAFTEAAEHFRHARICYQSLPRPYDAALMAEAAGRCALASSPSTTAGIAELADAVAELDALGATWDVARVRAELRTHPGSERPARGRIRYDERLSPREQEVAELAGAGLSNREIAATLHLSPRTVEQHVARALRKLGVASRNDLALKTHDNRVR
ncbi:helix-turn-helix transcriptional regulator [Streptomyces mirabilis]|uniref:helix-turn-helix transcriptional regulator n=1 Tax=Streptomyces mirabilis TaxID=68239 RepID=UPI0036C606CF